MFLTISNFSGQALEIADPYPSGQGYVLYIPANTTFGYFELTRDQFERIYPGLVDLETRPTVPGPGVTGSSMLFWDVAEDTTTPPFVEPRARQTTLPQFHVRKISKLTYSLSASSNIYTLTGFGFLRNQAIAQLTVGTGAGSVHYTWTNTSSYGNTVLVQHVKPGPSTALSVAMSADYTTVIVTLATDSSGAITSTAAQVVNAVNTSSTVQYFAVAAVAVAGTAQAAPATYMTGGKGPGWGYEWAGYGGAPTTITDTSLVFDFTGLGGYAGGIIGTVMPFYLMLGNSWAAMYPITIVA